MVPIYQTNSPEECHYVLDHSEASAVILEDAGQLEKIRKVRDQLPQPRARDLDGAARGRRRDQLRRAARARPRRAPTRTSSSAHRLGRALRRRDLHLHVGHDRPAQGLHHRPPATGATCSTWSRPQNVLMEEEVAYLFLPLAHAFARLIQLGSVDVGATIVYWERDPQKIIPNLMEVKPTYFPSVPRMFEKIYALAISSAPDKEQLDQAIKLGTKVRRDAAARRAAVPAELQAAFDKADAGAVPERAQPLRRPHQAGRHRRRADRAGDPRVLLRLRRARARGLGHDRDLDRRDVQHRRRTSASARSASPSPAWR